LQRETVATAQVNERRRGPGVVPRILSHLSGCPMIGQGRPTKSARALARIALAVCALWSCIAFAQEASPPNDPQRLHIAWGGGEPTRWTGRISLDKGSLSDLKLLSTDADAAGSLWTDSSQLHIADIVPHKSDIVELAASATPDAVLVVELSSEANAPPAKIQVPLADLQRRPFQGRLDDRGNTLEVRLVPESSLRIRILGDSSARDTLVFAPGEQLSFEIAPAIPAALHGTVLDIQTTLSKARRKEPIWSNDQKVEVPVSGRLTSNLNVPLPQVEGIYTVHVTITRPSGYFSNKFLPGAAAPIAEGNFQVAVVDPLSPSRDAKPDWASVLEIDPTNPRWVERLPSWTSQVRLIPGLNRGPQGSIRAGTVNLQAGRFIELPPTAASASPHWQAYSLPLQDVGMPHILEIDYPVSDEQHLGVSIVEPNAAGVLEGVYRDAGVFVEGLGRGEIKPMQTHRVVFWPRTQAPLLIITNEHPYAPAHFGAIRVLAHRGELSAGVASPANRDRLVAAYLARPLVSNGFGATEVAEAVGSGAMAGIADAQTAYESAARLSDYLRFSAYNSAVVSSIADGSATVPVSRILVTPRYDSEQLVNRSQRVDSLELMLRIFDRDRLTLIPAIEFTTPLPELETLRRANDSRSAGVELIGPNGRTWLEMNGSRGGLAPYYNVLNPQVQQAMLELVREFTQRYGNHLSFGGLAVQLHGDGYAQLPGLEWGLDDATIAQFERDTGIQIGATGEKRFEARWRALAVAGGQQVDAWRAWRSEQVANFYRRLTETVRGNTDRRTLLTTEQLFDHPQIGRRLRPSLPVEPIESRLLATMLDLGIDQQRLEQVPGLTFCSTRYVEPMARFPDRAADLELNDAFARRRQQPTPPLRAAAVLYHRPQELSLASLANFRTPFRMDANARLVSQPTPHDAAARLPYLQAMLNCNPAVLLDGGQLLPLAQIDSLREVRQILASLPAAARVMEVSKQPVIVRAYAEANQVTLVAMNLSPWKADAQVTLDVRQAPMLGPIATPGNGTGESPIKPLLLPTGQQTWKVALAPYDVQAVRIASPGTRPLAVDVNLSSAAQTELMAQVTDLSNRDLSAPRSYQSLANPSFEQLDATGQPLGWRVSAGNANATAVLDASGPQDGKSCLYFRNTGQAAARVESAPFRAPATGQLAMTVYARGENLMPGTELRLIFEAERDGLPYRCGTQAQPRSEWARPKLMWVSDLPLQSNGQMKIIFELTGPGEVWIDNVKLSDLLFSLSYYPNSQLEILQLVQQTHKLQGSLDEGQLSDCLTLMDGYWPRFIRAYTPPIPAKVALGPAAKPAAEPPNGAPQNPSPAPTNGTEQPAPGVGDRLKRMVPIFR